MVEKVLTGFCPNVQCQAQMFFTANSIKKQICLKCSQSHDIKSIKNIQPVTDPAAAIRILLQTFKKTIDDKIPDYLKASSESIKVKGLSNYSAKLISPLLTRYGLDKKTQTVKLLSEMGQGESFDCALLADRAFLIEQENLFIKGYGKIDTIAEYLKETLQQIYNVNNGEENIIPIYVDSDGHCLLHAISRALVGREIFWHPFSSNLKAHLIESKEKYKIIFKDFIEEEEWSDIIAEADPDFSQSGEIFGLRNIHIFALANCLHRPIILIDSAEGMFSKGDYCGVFLPYLIPVQKCKDSNGVLNKPILISWSNKGRNHFVPLVGIQGKQLPKFPLNLLPKVWGLPQELMYHYIDFENGCCTIGGSKSLSDRYLTKLINAMENHFRILKGVAPSVVTDVYHHICKPSGGISLTPQDVIDTAYALVKEERLHKCLLCQLVMEEILPFPVKWLLPGGKLYDIAIKTHKVLKNGYHYRFPDEGNVICSYNEKNNRLIYVQNVEALKCKNCGGILRVVKPDGTIAHINGDQLPTPANKNSKCGCGFKHFWDGKEYDNLPVKIPILLEWDNQKINDVIFWFQYEEDDCLNSNAFELAKNIVQRHFPGVFGSERLVEKVVDQIFCFVTEKSRDENSVQCLSENDSYFGSDPASTLNKIILRGAKSKTLHKEELNMSKKEEILRKKIEHHATVKQKRLSNSSPQKSMNISPEKLAELKTETKIIVSNAKKECRIRISMIGGKNETFVITDDAKYSDIENFVEEKFNINKNEQMIKMGFPPKTLTAFNLNELKPGDRLVVHVRKIGSTSTSITNDNLRNMDVSSTTGKSIYESNSQNASLISNNDITTDRNTKKKVDIQDDDPVSSLNQGLLSDSLFALMQSVDLWEWACTQRKLFQRDGIFYYRAVRDLGALRNGQHITLPCFPQKVFAYNQDADELFLCLGKEHITVKVLTNEEINAAKKCWIEQEQHGAIYSHKYDDASQKNFQSFSGKGYSLANKNNFKEPGKSIGNEQIETENITTEDVSDQNMTNIRRSNSVESMEDIETDDQSNTADMQIDDT